MTTGMWGRLCMKIAENDLDNIAFVAVDAMKLFNADAPMEMSTWGDD